MLVLVSQPGPGWGTLFEEEPLWWAAYDDRAETGLVGESPACGCPLEACHRAVGEALSVWRYAALHFPWLRDEGDAEQERRRRAFRAKGVAA